MALIPTYTKLLRWYWNENTCNACQFDEGIDRIGNAIVSLASDGIKAEGVIADLSATGGLRPYVDIAAPR